MKDRILDQDLFFTVCENLYISDNGKFAVSFNGKIMKSYNNDNSLSGVEYTATTVFELYKKCFLHIYGFAQPSQQNFQDIKNKINEAIMQNKTMYVNYKNKKLWLGVRKSLKDRETRYLSLENKEKEIKRFAIDKVESAALWIASHIENKTIL